jgi:hypothetical protein
LTVDGDVNLDGSIAFDLFNLTDFDLLNVLGDFAFSASSMFDFNLADGFELFDGYSIEFIFADNFQNFELFNFKNINFFGLDSNFAWRIGLNDSFDALSLTFTQRSNQVPEPSGLLLILSGLLWCLRRKKIASSAKLH